MINLAILVSLITISSAGVLPSHSSASSGQTYLPPDSGNTRAQQAIEKNAAVLRLEQEVGEEGFQYSYETSNNIKAEEAGDATQTKGGFSYKGDDGQTYSVTFTAGEGGFQPQGDHLPVPPPTPQEILLALQQNARDEAAGIYDDGQYKPDNNGQGGFTNIKSPNKPGFNPNSGYTY